MTEAGERWLVERINEKSGDLPEYGDMVGAMKFAIRLFCDDVTERAKALAGEQLGHDPNFVDYSEAFDELRRELLGE